MIVASLIILASYRFNYQYGIGNYQLQESRLLTRPYYYFNGKEDRAKVIADESCQLGIYCIEENREAYYRPRN